MRVTITWLFLIMLVEPACFGFPIDFCECGSQFQVEFLGSYAPLAAALSSLDADVNGDSSMEDGGAFFCEFGGNGVPDCSHELGLVSALLADPEIDLSDSGGVSYQLVYGAFNQNIQLLKSQLDNDYYALLPLFAPLFDIICGHLTIGDGMFAEVQPGQFVFSGSGGYAIGLLYAVPTSITPPAAMFEVETYSRLPEYLALWGDADGDGFTNIEEFMASATAEQYTAGALDPNLLGTTPINGGEGEGEGEGEAEGEGEGEGEGEPTAMPAATTLTAILIFSVYLLVGIVLHPRSKRRGYYGDKRTH